MVKVIHQDKCLERNYWENFWKIKDTKVVLPKMLFGAVMMSLIAAFAFLLELEFISWHLAHMHLLDYIFLSFGST